MKVSEAVICESLACGDVRHAGYFVPDVALDPSTIKVVMISEAAPAQASDHYYAGEAALFAQTTVQAFHDAGVDVASVPEILALGVYLTTAVKCAKTSYAIQPETVRACSRLLERELALFPEARVWMCMGDVAIKAVNEIARRAGDGRVIPAGSTYKIRSGEFLYRGKRVFPSYLQAGPSFFIEKSKRHMIAEDIAAALRWAED
jgi:uracil-DNA glycosylase